MGYNKGKLLLNKIFIIILSLILSVCLALGIKNVLLRKVFYRLDYFDQVTLFSQEFNLDSALVFATINVESRFNKDRVSNKGAMGLMQITKNTADFIAQNLKVKEYDIFDAKTNIRFGCYYLRYLIEKFECLGTVICAYNAGEGRVRQWLKDFKYSEDGRSLKQIPVIETREYYNKIIKSLTNYKKIYNNILDKNTKFS